MENLRIEGKKALWFIFIRESLFNGGNEKYQSYLQRSIKNHVNNNIYINIYNNQWIRGRAKER